MNTGMRQTAHPLTLAQTKAARLPLTGKRAAFLLFFFDAYILQRRHQQQVDQFVAGTVGLLG